MKITPEDIYSTWHREVFRVQGKRVRGVKNFANAQAKDNWVYFVRCADMVNRNCGQIDYRIFVQSLAEYYEGWFDPARLIARSSIKIYKTHTAITENRVKEHDVHTSLCKSIDFIATYCVENDLKEFCDYLSEGQHLIPTILKHYYSGSVSINLLASINSFELIVDSYPKDVVSEYIGENKEKMQKARSRILVYDKTRKIAEKLEDVITALINKKKEEQI